MEVERQGKRVPMEANMINSLYTIALLALMIPQGGNVSGKILDREGKPLASAAITYTHIGTYSNSPDAQTGTGNGSLTNSGTGKVYKTKTNKKGEFQMIGLAIGVYKVEIRD